jgi:hypothetical protein
MKISEIAAYLKKMSGERQEYASRTDDMDIPDEVVLAFIVNFLTKNLIELSPESQASPRQKPFSRNSPG